MVTTFAFRVSFEPCLASRGTCLRKDVLGNATHSRGVGGQNCVERKQLLCNCHEVVLASRSAWYSDTEGCFRRGNVNNTSDQVIRSRFSPSTIANASHFPLLSWMTFHRSLRSVLTLWLPTRFQKERWAHPTNIIPLKSFDSKTLWTKTITPKTPPTWSTRGERQLYLHIVAKSVSSKKSERKRTPYFLAEVAALASGP